MNFISLVGRIHEGNDSRTRFLEVGKPEATDDGNNLLIPCRYWTLDDRNYLTSIKLGTLLIVRGRIDSDEKIGLFVIVESITIVSK